MSGTITLPSGDKLITQTEILGSGALVHREEVVVSGTISGRLALPTNTNPSLNDYGLPVREISGPKIGVPGTPLRIDPTGSTTQPVSIASPVTVTHPGTIGVIVTSQPSISFNGPQPISSVAGTVQVAFTPAAVQNVNLMNVGFSGTPLRVDPTGQTTQPVSMAGSISLADYARYSEQLIQSSRLSTIDTDVISIRNAVVGTPAFKFASPQEITWSGTPSVVVSAHPPISFSSPQPISTISGTVHVAFTPAASQNVNLLNVGFSGTPLRIDPTGTTVQPVSISGTLSIPDYARYSEQLTQSSRLNSIDTDVLLIRDAVIGTPAVKFASPQAITFLGQQPIHGTVVVSSIPSVAFTGPQPISTIAGTVSVSFPSIQTVSISGSISLADYARHSEQLTQSSRLSTIDTGVIAVRDAVIGTPGVNVSSLPPISFASPQQVTFSGQQPIHGTVVISSIPSVTVNSLPNIIFSGAQPISTVAGTVSVAFPSAQSVNVSNTPAVTFSGQQPVHGTVVVSSLPPITFASPQAISTVAGTVNVAFTPASVQDVHLKNVGFAGTPMVVSFSGTPAVNIADMPSISLSPITFASPQPISTIAGTVAVAFTPAASQNVILTTPTTAGSVLALYSEQQLQTTALQLIDDTVHAANAAFSKSIGIGGQRDDESITLATENAVAPVRITSYRAQHVSLRNEIGVEIGSAGTPLRIDPTGTTTQPVSNTVLSVVGGGEEATAQRVTIANDSTGVLSVDDNGGSITVDGEVNVKLLNYGHSGTPLRVDPTGTTIQPISWTGIPTVSIPGTITANIRNNIYSHKQTRIDVHGAGNHIIVAGQANRRIKVYAINAQASAGGTVNIAWMDGTLPMAGTQTYSDREGYVMAVSPPAFLLAPQPGTALVAHMGTILNSGGGIRGWINYWDDDSF